MKKSVYMAILTIITIACIFIGSIRHLGLFRMNLFDSWEHVGTEIADGIVKETTKEIITKEIADVTTEIVNETVKEVADEIRDDTSERPASATYSDNVDSADESVSKIDIDCRVMTLSMEYGKKFDVSYDCNNDDLNPAISIQNGTLSITQSTKGGRLSGHHSESHHLFDSSICNLTVTIPKGTELEDIHTKIDVGDVELENLSVQSCEIAVNVGNIELEDFACASLTASSNTGDIECEDCDIQDAKIDCNIGNVTLKAKNFLLDCDITLSTDVGEVHAFGENHGRSYSHSGSHGSITITSNIGDITVK